MTEINTESENDIENYQGNQEEEGGIETTLPVSMEPQDRPIVIGETTELRKAKMRYEIEQETQAYGGASGFIAKKLKEIVVDSLIEGDARGRDTAIKALKEMGELMGYKESNQTTTIRSNVPNINQSEASTW